MKKLIFATLFLATISFSFAQESNWVFDKSHSNVRFAVAHMVISEVEGSFSDFSGTVTTKGDNFDNANINFTIAVNSIDTKDEKRDAHLLNEDFFDAPKYPEITFKSTKMEKVSDSKYKLTGELSMHGVTKEITLDVKYGGTIVDPWGNTKAGFKVMGSINRTDWNLKYNSVMDTGGLMIGEEIDLVCNVELAMKK